MSRRFSLHRASPRPHRLMIIGGTVAAMGLSGVLLAYPASASGGQSISSAGPLTAITTTTDLNCAVRRTGDTAGEFFGGTACGTFLAIGGTASTSTLFGPAHVPAGSTGPTTPWTPVSQAAPTGDGSTLRPYTIVTVVAASGTGVRLTQTDTYVAGQDAYRTDIAVANTGSTAVTAVLYRAGDCYLQDSDSGYGSVDTSTGAVGCTAGTSADSRIIQWFPISAGSSHLEAGYSEVWAAIGSHEPFSNSCRCSMRIDNGAGLSWSVAVPAGRSVTRSHLTSFSPIGSRPLATTKAADQATALGSGSDGYTISVSNPNLVPVTVDSLYDDLPAGFRYTAASTSGASTGTPTVVGQHVQWSGPFILAANGTITLHFRVTVSDIGGRYFNNAGGAAGSYTVAPTGDTAPVTVLERTALTADPAVASSSGSANVLTLKAHVSSARTGAPLAGRSVAFKVGAATVCTTLSNSAGLATCDASGQASALVLNNGYDATATLTASYGPAGGHGALVS